jgi:hypothetical protein
MSPAAIKQAMAAFAAQDPTHRQFLELRENRGLAKHLGTLLQLLSVNDDPLTIEADIMTSRWVLLALVGFERGLCRVLLPILSTLASADCPSL